MIEIMGKYTTAKVFADILEPDAYAQLLKLVNQEFMDGCKVRVMPDVHMGKGCTIGTTIAIGQKVVPNLVGVDIGCGMLTVKLGKIDLDLEKLDAYIRKFIPSGTSNNKNKMAKLQKLEDLRCLKSLSKSAGEFEFAIGSLGGGNHFIEVGVDEEDEKYLVIHSGSRNLGNQVAKYYQNVAINDCKGKGIDKELSYLEGAHRDDYLHDMKIVQEYASLNRRTMAARILNGLLRMKLDSFEHFSTIHNYIEMESNMLRKGAVSAKDGEKLLIPINMRDGSLLCVGKGKEDWNQSAPHGAGRLMSRSKAKEDISIEEFEDSMKDVFSKSVGLSTIDEAPQAYKPIESIIENVKDSVEIIARIKPIYNFKA